MKREVSILGLSYSQTQAGAYVIVLSETRGSRKLPVIIKPTEAQVIAHKLENMKPLRPMTHDLFKVFAQQFNADIQEAVIYNVAEGIFYSKIVCSDGIDESDIECTAGDAIALSLCFGCPIYVEELVLASAGVEMSEDGKAKVALAEHKSPKTIEEPTVEELQKKMQEALANEDYEIAAELRDQIALLNANTDDKI